MSSEQQDVLDLKITYALHDIALALCEVHGFSYESLVAMFRELPHGNAIESLGSLIESADRIH